MRRRFYDETEYENTICARTIIYTGDYSVLQKNNVIFAYRRAFGRNEQ